MLSLCDTLNIFINPNEYMQLIIIIRGIIFNKIYKYFMPVSDGYKLTKKYICDMKQMYLENM